MEQKVLYAAVANEHMCAASAHLSLNNCVLKNVFRYERTDKPGFWGTVGNSPPNVYNSNLQDFAGFFILNM